MPQTEQYKQNLRVIFAGGGTGGHLYPAIALAEAFKQHVENVQILFIGAPQGIEARVLPSLGYQLKLVPIRGLLRKLTLRNLAVPVRLLQSILKCISIFQHFKPDIVIGTGGYVSGPALLAALLARKKFVIQEQNSFPGLVNRKLGNFAKAIFLSFEESRKFFKGQKKIHVVGNPIRNILTKADTHKRSVAAKKWHLDTAATTLFIFGGSQGALKINQIIEDLLPQLSSIAGLQILWMTGQPHYEKFSKQIAQYPSVSVVPYIDDMSLAYALADFVVCRAGASTISELTLCGLPSILVPFPYATADHQTFNARVLERAGAAHVFLEKNLEALSLLNIIQQITREKNTRQRMSDSAKKMGKPNAAEDIVNICLDIITTYAAKFTTKY